MRAVPTLPPGYNYVRYNTRIQIKYPKDECRQDDPNAIVYQRLPGYWYKDENAAKAAWKHYSEERERLRQELINPQIKEKQA